MSPFITTKRRFAPVNGHNEPHDAVRIIRLVNAALLLLAAMIVAGYVAMMHGTVSRGYELQRLQERLVALASEQDTLSRQASELQSPQHLTEAMGALGLVPAETIAYTVPAAVAKADDRAIE